MDTFLEQVIRLIEELFSILTKYSELQNTDSQLSLSI